MEKRVCDWCGKSVKAGFICSRCSEKLPLVRELKEMVGKPSFNPKAEVKAKPIPKKKIKRDGNKALYAFLKELKEYNEKNGTFLSYGQYVAMKEKQNEKEKQSTSLS